jgi:hypothetical protein
MATREFEINGTEWTLIANADDDPVLVTSEDEGVYAFATLAAPGTPDVRGHKVRLGATHPAEGVSRAVGLVGYLYAMTADGTASATLSVDGSSVE